jgi:hypothetical protein
MAALLDDNATGDDPGPRPGHGMPFPVTGAMVRPILPRGFVLFSSLVLAACPDPTEPGVPATLVLSITSVTFDAIGATQPVLASVRDQRGQPMNAAVTWSSSSTTVAVTVEGSLATLTAMANGPATITATAGGIQATLSAQVTQVPVAPVKVSGDLQTGTVGTPLALPLQVKVQDRLGAMIPGHPVTFTVLQGGGSVTVATGTTGSDGLASTTWTLGTSATASHQVSAAVGHGLEAVFNATAQAGPPVELVATAGQGQTATVGTGVPQAPALLVRDAFGNPVPGVSVGFAIGAGGGTISGGTGAVTASSGVAAVAGWILGPVAGPNTLIAAVAGVAPLVFSAVAQPGPPASLTAQAGQGQAAPAGSAVAVAPAVRVADQFGNPVPGVTVFFAVTGGGGSIQNGTVPTDPGGIASPGIWTLGAAAGPNTLTATVTGLPPVQFTATAVPVPASLAIAGGNNQTVPPGSAVPIPPSVIVRDGQGSPIPGVGVSFAVTAGGGSLTGGSATTGANGIATVGSWTLGVAPGLNGLTASVAGLPSVTFTATGAGGGAPASVVLSTGNAGTALPGSALATSPAVVVRDASGIGVAGVTVTFAITGGSGSLTGATAVTNSSGVATVGSWTVGAGANCLTATVAGGGVAGNPVSFVATGLPAPGPGYEISVQYLSCVTPAQEAAFASAAARWGAIITGDLADIAIGSAAIPAGSCGLNSPTLVNTTIDDLLIFATIEPIDGPGAVLGQAGWCFRRTTGNLPAIGLMRFDIADVNGLEASGRLTDVILHEMGHVIGIGTSWTLFGLLQNPSPVGGPPLDTHHNGANAIAGFNAIGGNTYTGGNKVPVENMFGSGTINSHWREAVLANELMTGFIGTGSNPLSALTVRSLADFGYTINAAAADPFFLTLAVRGEGPPEVLIRLEDDIYTGPRYTIDSRGRFSRVR